MRQIRIVYDHIPQVSQELAHEVERTVAAAAREVESAAKRRAPVDTGALRNSIQAWQDTPYRWHIAPHVEYALYVEYGTRRQRAKPYMTPAAEFVRPRFIAAMKKVLG